MVKTTQVNCRAAEQPVNVTVDETHPDAHGDSVMLEFDLSQFDKTDQRKIYSEMKDMYYDDILVGNSVNRRNPTNRELKSFNAKLSTWKVEINSEVSDLIRDFKEIVEIVVGGEQLEEECIDAIEKADEAQNS